MMMNCNARMEGGMMNALRGSYPAVALKYHKIAHKKKDFRSPTATILLFCPSNKQSSSSTKATSPPPPNSPLKKEEEGGGGGGASPIPSFSPLYPPTQQKSAGSKKIPDSTISPSEFAKFEYP